MALNDNLLRNLSLSPFDQVVVVPQSRINSKIQYDFKADLFPSTFKYSPTSPATQPTLTAALLAPIVFLIRSVNRVAVLISL